jgi:hypothetical protein
MGRGAQSIQAHAFLDRMVKEGLIVSLDGKTFVLTEKGRAVAATYREKEAA